MALERQSFTQHETKAVEAVHPRADAGIVELGTVDAVLDRLDRFQPTLEEVVVDELTVGRFGLGVVGPSIGIQAAQRRVVAGHQEITELR